jgi:hypothetical protein
VPPAQLPCELSHKLEFAELTHKSELPVSICRRNDCAGVPRVQSAKYNVSSLSSVTVTLPALLLNLLESCATGCTGFLVVASWTTRGEADRGARLRAETEEIRGTPASAVRIKFFMIARLSWFVRSLKLVVRSSKKSANEGAEVRRGEYRVEVAELGNIGKRRDKVIDGMNAWQRGEKMSKEWILGEE